MALEDKPASAGFATFKGTDGIKPLDAETGSIGATTLVNGLIGFAGFNFTFFNGGGTDNLSPGRETTQTLDFQYPAGAAGALVSLRSVSGAFVNAGGATLAERPLGKYEVSVGFTGSNTLSCLARLTDANGDDPVQISVDGTIYFYR
jgi:hypothetical protein